MRGSKWELIKPLLKTLQEFFPAEICVALIIKPDNFWQKQKTNFGSAKFSFEVSQRASVLLKIYIYWCFYMQANCSVLFRRARPKQFKQSSFQKLKLPNISPDDNYQIFIHFQDCNPSNIFSMCLIHSVFMFFTWNNLCNKCGLLSVAWGLSALIMSRKFYRTQGRWHVFGLCAKTQVNSPILWKILKITKTYPGPQNESLCCNDSELK